MAVFWLFGTIPGVLMAAEGSQPYVVIGVAVAFRMIA